MHHHPTPITKYAYDGMAALGIMKKMEIGQSFLWKGKFRDGDWVLSRRLTITVSSLPDHGAYVRVTRVA